MGGWRPPPRHWFAAAPPLLYPGGHAPVAPVARRGAPSTPKLLLRPLGNHDLKNTAQGDTIRFAVTDLPTVLSLIYHVHDLANIADGGEARSRRGTALRGDLRAGGFCSVRRPLLRDHGPGAGAAFGCPGGELSGLLRGHAVLPAFQDRLGCAAAPRAVEQRAQFPVGSRADGRDPHAPPDLRFSYPNASAPDFCPCADGPIGVGWRSARSG